MSDMIWTNVSFRVAITWFNLISLLTILTYHAYRLCQKDLEGSPIKIFGFLSFKHLSFIVIIAALIPTLAQTIMYTPQQPLSDTVCGIASQMGIVCLAVSKLALHLFVAVRSQVAHTKTNRLYTIGLILTLTDVLFVIYVSSGIPTIISTQNGVVCELIDVSFLVYIWFGINDFVIGMYCLLAFIFPLKKYLLLERQDVTPTASPNTIDSELRHLVNRIMIFSGIALVSTMAFTVISSIVRPSGAVLMMIDATINSLCVVLQFKHSCEICVSYHVSQTVQSLSVSQMDASMASMNTVTVIIHEYAGAAPADDGDKHVPCE
eukprot:73324_1